MICVIFFFDVNLFFFFFFSSRRRHTRCREVSWARRCVQETGYQRRVHGDMIKTLLDLGSNVNATTIGGDTPLLKAAAMNNRKVIDFLCTRGASKACKNRKEQSIENFLSMFEKGSLDADEYEDLSTHKGDEEMKS
eukprot:TRINITY_DN67926_c0_g1_i2.p2 TRINITY_DN67926_c0_g1~~TRINITY_DN67926_c0_g1_i2.p2  ORF type:complete len:136 (-),score=59.89 TRINITY_DN67926_c0_g1_i2:266-673(-)